ncbi:PaaI family thioesterase [Jannaschia marina]|uniref:PaaI family thioesterase n=1 Tax=Jannaschia marina TaxID=2741674 RepID=UPI0015CE731A|nr:PaaI family thioesterase [Jannaschia marina]
MSRLPPDGPGLIRGETGTQRLLGYVLDVRGGQGGSARCHMEITDDHTNRHGVLHGGITTSILDNAMGATASLTVDGSGTAPFLTVSMTVNFMAPAHSGQLLIATGRKTGGGRSTLFVEGDLEADDGTRIATASGVFRKVPTHRLEGR